MGGKNFFLTAEDDVLHTIPSR